MNIARGKAAVVLAIIVAAFLAFDLYKAESQPIESAPGSTATNVTQTATTPGLFEPASTVRSDATFGQTQAPYSSSP